MMVVEQHTMEEELSFWTWCEFCPFCLYAVRFLLHGARSTVRIYEMATAEGPGQAETQHT